MPSTSSQNKSMFSILLGILIVIFAVGLVTYLKYGRPSGNSPSGTSSTTKHYENTAQGLQFDYPSFFTLTENLPLISLISPYYTVQNFVGTESNNGASPEFVAPSNKFFFSITMETRSVSLEEAMDQDNPSFSPTYQQLKNGQVVDKSFLDTTTIDKKTGYVFSFGAEGINMKHVYVSQNPQKTLVIKLSFIGDFLKDQVKPSPFSEQQQLDAFNAVLSSLKLN